jgi:Zn-dependent protease with chaperone function
MNATAPRVRATTGLTWRYLWTRQSSRWSNGMIAGLVVAWTGLPIGLWALASGAFAGAIIGAFGGASSGVAHTLHIGPGVGFGAAVIGAFIGLFYGFLFICGLVFTHLFFVAGGIASGFVIAYVTLWLLIHFEDQLLRLRGYRDPSRREQELVVPIVVEILQRMDIVGYTPRFYVSDSKEPAAWTHANSIVLTQGLLGSYDDSENPPVPDMPHHALAAVVAHEMSHWAGGTALESAPFGRVAGQSWPPITLLASWVTSAFSSYFVGSYFGQLGFR